MADQPHQHVWRVVASRYLHGVEPRTKVNDLVCDCGARSQTETQEPQR